MDSMGKGGVVYGQFAGMRTIGVRFLYAGAAK
jgi:hypothetical protein